MGLGVGRQYSPSQEIIFIYSPLSTIELLQINYML
jgi:hypothetical protein